MLSDVVVVGLEWGCRITSRSILSTLTSFFYHPLLLATWQISTFYFVSIRHLWTELWEFDGMGVAWVWLDNVGDQSTLYSHGSVDTVVVA